MSERVYVAGKFSQYERCRALMDRITAAGHRITYDWTRTSEFGSDGHPMPHADVDHGAELPEDVQQGYARNDRIGVLSASVVVVLADADIYGALIELGLALANKARVIVVAPRRYSIFFSLPRVSVVADEDEAIEQIK